MIVFRAVLNGLETLEDPAAEPPLKMEILDLYSDSQGGKGGLSMRLFSMCYFSY